MDFEDQKEQDLWQLLSGKTGDERADILIELAHRALQRKQGNEALALTEEAYGIYKANGAATSSSDLANAITGISHSLKALNQLEDAIKTIDGAISIQREAGISSLADTLRTKAFWLVQLGQQEQAISTFLEIVQINELEDNPEFVGRDLYNIGHCYMNLKNWVECIRHSERAREAFIAGRLYDEVSWCDAQLALAYAQLENAEIAKDLAERSLAFGELRNNLALKCLNLLTLGIAATTVEEFTQAEEHLLEAREIAAGSTDWEMIERIEKELMNLYVVTGQRKRAKEIDNTLVALRETMLQEAN